MQFLAKCPDRNSKSTSKHLFIAHSLAESKKLKLCTLSKKFNLTMNYVHVIIMFRYFKMPD